MKILNNDMYLLLIDEKAEIKEGNYVYSVLYGIGKIIRDYGGESTKNYRPLVAKFQESEVQQEYGRDGIWQMDVVGEKVAKNNCNKVIAYYPLKKEAKELDLPLLPNPFENKIDIIALAIEIYGDSYDSLDQIEAFKTGYKAAQAKQFSLEDMKKAFIDGLEFIAVDPNRYEEDADNYIQSIYTQQLPKEFVPEKTWINSKGEKANNFCDVALYEENINDFDAQLILKTITTSEGKREVQGKYVY